MAWHITATEEHLLGCGMPCAGNQETDKPLDVLHLTTSRVCSGQNKVSYHFLQSVFIQLTIFEDI